MEAEKVHNNTAQQQFEIRVESYLAFLQYEMKGDNIILIHTEVPPELEGKGIGSALARAGLDFAREDGFGVVPECPFVRSYIQQHPEYKELVKPKRV